MFAETGLLRVDGAFSPGDASMMSDVLWGVFERQFGILRCDPSSWDREFRKSPLERAGSGPLFEAVFSDRLADALDEVLGSGNWSWPRELGDLLITFPNAPAWTLPHLGWHRDRRVTSGSERPAAVKVFFYLNDVQPSGGGTLVVQGSHLLHPAGPPESKRDRIFDDCPWLGDLATPGDGLARKQRFMDEGTNVDGIDLRVVELSGVAGDAVLMHPGLMHTAAPNASTEPRFMRGPFIGR